MTLTLSLWNFCCQNLDAMAEFSAILFLVVATLLQNSCKHHLWILRNLLYALVIHLSLLQNIFNIESSNCKTKKPRDHLTRFHVKKPYYVVFIQDLVFCEPQCTTRRSERVAVCVPITFFVKYSHTKRLRLLYVNDHPDTLWKACKRCYTCVQTVWLQFSCGLNLCI